MNTEFNIRISIHMLDTPLYFRMFRQFSFLLYFIGIVQPAYADWQMVGREIEAPLASTPVSNSNIVAITEGGRSILMPGSVEESFWVEHSDEEEYFFTSELFVDYVERTNSSWKLSRIGLEYLGGVPESTPYTPTSLGFSSNGKRMVIGYYYGAGFGEESDFAVNIWELLSGSWQLMDGGYLLNNYRHHRPGLGNEDELIVSMSGDGLVVAVGVRAPGGESEASVQIFANVANTWVQIGDDIRGGISDYFGYALSLSEDGSRLAIGAPGYSGNDGHVVVYDFDGSWNQVGGSIDPDSFILSFGHPQFGYTVALSADGSRLALGANNAGLQHGGVAVYELADGDWDQLGTYIASSPGEYFGDSLSFSADGTRFAASGSFGPTRIYDYANDKWSQVGTDLPGKGSTVPLHLRQYMAMSGDGSRVVIDNKVYEYVVPTGGLSIPVIKAILDRTGK